MTSAAMQNRAAQASAGAEKSRDDRESRRVAAGSRRASARASGGGGGNTGGGISIQSGKSGKSGGGSGGSKTGGAIYHVNVRRIQRSSGGNAVGLSAYIRRDLMVDERTNSKFDFTKDAQKAEDCTYAEMIFPTGTPRPQDDDPERIFNLAEQCEKRSDATIGREMIVALPRGLSILSIERNEILAKEIAQQIADRYHCVADVAMHNDDGNPHAHIIFSSREWDDKKQTFGKKIRQLDAFQTRKNEVRWQRETVANTINDHIKKAGFLYRVTHLSFADRGIDQVPTEHQGKAKKEIAKREEAALLKSLNDIKKEIKNESESDNQRRRAINSQIPPPHRRGLLRNVSSGDVVLDKIRRPDNDELLLQKNVSNNLGKSALGNSDMLCETRIDNGSGSGSSGDRIMSDSTIRLTECQENTEVAEDNPLAFLDGLQNEPAAQEPAPQASGKSEEAPRNFWEEVAAVKLTPPLPLPAKPLLTSPLPSPHAEPAIDLGNLSGDDMLIAHMAIMDATEQSDHYQARRKAAEAKHGNLPPQAESDILLTETAAVWKLGTRGEAVEFYDQEILLNARKRLERLDKDEAGQDTIASMRDTIEQAKQRLPDMRAPAADWAKMAPPRGTSYQAKAVQDYLQKQVRRLAADRLTIAKKRLDQDQAQRARRRIQAEQDASTKRRKTPASPKP